MDSTSSDFSLSPTVVGIIGVVVLVLLVGFLITRRVKVAGPNEAFIITGRKGKTGDETSGQKTIVGGSVFVIPFVQRLHVMNLSARRIPVRIVGAISQNGIKCDLEGVAIIKVGGNEADIRAAAQRFLGQQEGIDAFTQEVLAGSLRSIVGRLSVRDIIGDRAAFASAVAEEAETSLTNQGLALDTFQLQDIQTEGSYLEDLGRPEAARVQKEAAIAEAQAQQEAEQKQLLAREATAVANRQLELKQAEIKAEVDAASAQAAAAGPIAQAAQDQNVLAEQEKVALRNAALKDRQLDTEIRKPADAARYQVEQEAQASKNSAIAQAEAEQQATVAAAQAQAERDRLLGEGQLAQRTALARATEVEGKAQGAAERQRREAIAAAVEREGQAEGAAILAKGTAEAEARQKNAEAFESYNEAAVIELLVRMTPEIVRAAAEPISAIDKLTVISTDGASQLTRNVAGNLETGLQIGSDILGVDLRQLAGSFAQARAKQAPSGTAAATEDTPEEGPTS